MRGVVCAQAHWHCFCAGSLRAAPHAPSCRPSANLAAMNGGVQPSLEQLRPDMFFGADSDDESGGCGLFMELWPACGV